MVCIIIDMQLVKYVSGCQGTKLQVDMLHGPSSFSLKPRLIILELTQTDIC